MADFAGISAAGLSIQRLLTLRFEEAPPLDRNVTVVLARAEDFEPDVFPQFVARPALTLFLYRVGANRTTRAAWSAVGAYDGRSHLALDLHFLLFAWADNADDESRILGRAMQVIEDTPIISGPLLAGNLDWAPHEAL